MLVQRKEAQCGKKKPKPRVCPLADIAIKINKGGRGGNDAAEGGAALYLTETAQYILNNGELRNSVGEATVDTLKSRCSCG